MRLSSLRLFGFKTFAESTVLPFEPGITALVGPNGSGKSNLVDAIRWVLGEQSPKALRSTRTEDVIFAGNERRKPLGMTEVSLTFANDDRMLPLDAHEVAITRRAYRAGESEFFINRQSVRLRDVIELLMGTGLGPGSYAIVSQGQIDAILAAKPSERRSLFEETAGINKFLARKAESLRRLEQTERNGIRLNDLLVEIGARIPELETQARRARRYHKVSARVRDLEILAYLRAGASRRAEREGLKAQLERFDVERAAAAAQATTAQADLSRLRSELYECERTLEALHRVATQSRSELADAQADIAAQSARRDALTAQASQFVGDHEHAARERAELAASLEQLECELAPCTARLDVERDRERQAHAALSAARARLDALFTELREVEATAAADAATQAERRAHIAATENDYRRLEGDIETFRREAHSASERIAELMRDLAVAQSERAALEERAAIAQAASKEADERVAAAGAALGAAQSAYRAATSEVASAEARLHTIEELEANLEGHVPGTRAALEAAARGDFGGLLGVVSNLVRVDEPYARALDIAFGAALSNIVTETAEDAERAIAFLRAREAGRATFLPLDTLGARAGRDARETPKMPGVIAYAHALVEPTEPRYAGIVAFLVGRILIVESLEVAVGLVRGRGFRDAIVTLEGDEIRGGGAMTGGRYKRERSILSRRAQARTLSAALPRLRTALEAAQSTVAAASHESAEATAMRDTAHRVAGELAVALRDAVARSETLDGERDRLAREADALLARASERERDAAAARERLAVLERPPAAADVTQESRQRLEGELDEAREAIARAQADERAVAGEIASARESVAALVARIDGARARLQLLDVSDARAAEARAAIKAELDTLVDGLRERTAAVEALRSAASAADERVSAAAHERETAQGRTLELESALRLAQNAEREAAGASENGRLRLAEIDAELGMLAAGFAAHPATAAECADVERRYENEHGDVAPELARLREELTRLQNVNLNAAREIEELIERERFLRAQLDDLGRARETLLASIHEIEASSQSAFNETFAAVRTAFENVYARLFAGGQAKMWQTDPEHLSETGIEISVQPPGKKMMPLAALSGGERAMAASALIFALIHVKPSPFYLLDEVDAALDEANIERFSQLVRELGAEAQLLLVTHNKKTMELAERMYGVTMSEPGISRVIGADLAAATAPDEPASPAEPQPVLVGAG